MVKRGVLEKVSQASLCNRLPNYNGWLAGDAKVAVLGFTVFVQEFSMNGLHSLCGKGRAEVHFQDEVI